MGGRIGFGLTTGFAFACKVCNGFDGFTVTCGLVGERVREGMLFATGCVVLVRKTEGFVLPGFGKTTGFTGETGFGLLDVVTCTALVFFDCVSVFKFNTKVSVVEVRFSGRFVALICVDFSSTAGSLLGLLNIELLSGKGDLGGCAFNTVVALRSVKH